MKKHLLLAFSFAFILVQLTSCDKTTDPIVPAKKYLVSATLYKEYTKESLISSFGSQGSLLAAFVNSGIKQYKIVYKTTNTDGKEIEASGAFMMPSNSTAIMPLLSLQHGTITKDTDAPSYFSTTGEAQIGSFFASVGNLVVMPDYIGYGTSNALPHTYEHRNGLATASLDLIRAIKEYITDQKLNWNKNLMIGGYSEGGFATMSLQKKIETEFPTEFALKASSCGGGAYNKTATIKALLNNEGTTNPSYNSLYLWVLLTYNRVYEINRTPAYYFKEPYATSITTQNQNAQINVGINNIVTDTFKNGINNNTDTAFMNALKDNDVFDWKPVTPTRLYHGDADDLVPYFNSKTAYDAMVAKGASVNVSLVTLKGKTHSSAIQDYLLGTFEMFSTYNK